MEEAKVSQQEIKFIAEFLDSFDLDEEIEYDEEGNDVRAMAAAAAANNASDASGGDVDIVTHKHLEKVGRRSPFGLSWKVGSLSQLTELR